MRHFICSIGVFETDADTIKEAVEEYIEIAQSMREYEGLDALPDPEVRYTSDDGADVLFEDYDAVHIYEEGRE